MSTVILIELRWIFLLKIILNIIWFYYKIQLVCHIEFFRRKRNKTSEETMHTSRDNGAIQKFGWQVQSINDKSEYIILTY